MDEQTLPWSVKSAMLTKGGTRMSSRSLTLNGSPSAVFSALTKAEEVTTWWGDDSSYRTVEWKADVRPEGEWSARFASPDGQGFSSSGTYTAVHNPDVLDWTWVADWSPTAVKQIAMRLEAQGDGTRMIVTTGGHRDEQERLEDERGWDQILGWLADYLATRRG